MEKQIEKGVIYLTNAFSINMIPVKKAYIEIHEVSIDSVKFILKNHIPTYYSKIVSAIGHEGTAAIMSKLLGIQVPVNRIEIKFTEKDMLIVFQIRQRLPEGKVLSEEEISKLPVSFYIVEYANYLL